MNSKLSLTLDRILCLICIVVVLNGCTFLDRSEYSEKQDKTGQNQKSADTPSEAAARLSSGFKRNNDNTISSLRSRWRRAYKVPPDRRFLEAIAEVHQLLTRTPAERVRASFDGSKWRLTYKGLDAGTLTDFATFDEQFALVSQWAKKLSATNNVSFINGATEDDAQATFASLSASVDALLAENRTWSTKPIDLKHLSGISRAFTNLTLQQVDSLEIADSIPAKAICMAALLSVKVDSFERDRLLLCFALGYIADGRRHLTCLKADDPLKNYLTQKTDGTSGLVRGNDNSRLARFLLLKRLATQRSTKEWKTLINSNSTSKAAAIGLPELATLISGSPEDTLLPICFRVIGASLREVEGGKTRDERLSQEELSYTSDKFIESPQWMMSGLMEQFEKALAQRQITDGPIIDRATVGALYRGYLFSAVDALSLSYLNFPEGRSLMERFAQTLQAKKQGVDAQLTPWLITLLAVHKSGISVDRLHAAIQSMDNLGGSALLTMIESAGNYYESKTALELLPVIRFLLSKCDCRPNLRARLAILSKRQLLLPKLSITLMEADKNAAFEYGIADQMKIVFANRDIASAWRLNSNKGLSLTEKLELLRFIAANSTDIKQIKTAYIALLKASGNDWRVVDATKDFLASHAEQTQAVLLIKSWLDANRKLQSIEQENARCSLAELYLSLNLPKEALSTLTPLLRSEKLTPMILNARTRELLHQTDEAEAWVVEILKRYPDSMNAIAAAMEIYWTNSHYKKAAELLGANTSRLSPSIWRATIAPLFLRIFGANPRAAALAINEMLDYARMSPDCLGQIAIAADWLGYSQIGFEILSKLHEEQDKAEIITLGYRFLKDWQGKKKARTWLEMQLPETERVIVAPFAFYTGQFELLWDIPLKVTGQQNEDQLFWLYRAAAFATEQTHLPLQSSAIADYYQQHSSPLHHLAMYLIGKEPQSALLNFQCTTEDLSRYSFYIGWKNLCDGTDYFDATEWLHMSVDSNGTGVERDWAWNWLSDLESLTYREVGTPQSIKKLKISPASGNESHGGFDIAITTSGKTIHCHNIRHARKSGIQEGREKR